MYQKRAYVSVTMEILYFEEPSADILSSSTDPYMLDGYDLSWLE